MMTNKPGPQHVEFTSCDKVAELMRPLQALFHMNHFGLIRATWDCKKFSLCSDSKWIKNFWERDYHLINEGYPLIKGGGLYFNNDFNMQSPFGEMIKDLEENFNTGHLVYYIQQHIGYTDFWVFGAPLDQTNFQRDLLLHQDYIMKFLLHFKDKANSLIKEGLETAYNIPLGKAVHVKMKNKIGEQFSTNKSDVLDIKQYHLQNDSGDNIVLTQREVDCIQLLCQGLRYKEMARLLYVSTRTIEQRIDKIRMKFNCDSKKELITKINAMQLMDLLNARGKVRQNLAEVKKIEDVFLKATGLRRAEHIVDDG